MSIHTVTGAFGYSGKFIAKRLLESGIQVNTLTNSPDRKSFLKDKIKVHSFNFDNPEMLIASLEGTEVLYNTYWVRFNHSSFTHEDAVKNTLILFDKVCLKNNRIINAIGPETFTYTELVKVIGEIINIRPRIVYVNPGIGYLASKLIGLFMNDVFVTKEEIQGLMQDLLCVDDSPAGKRKFK